MRPNKCTPVPQSDCLIITSSVHHQLSALVEAHVCITQQTACHFGQHFVIPVREEEKSSFLRQPPSQVFEGNHFRDVVAILFSCGAERENAMRERDVAVNGNLKAMRTAGQKREKERIIRRIV